jgi:hypothetical protein
MAKKQAQDEAQAQKYAMPRVEPGMPVVWWEDLGDHEAGQPPTAPAFVSAVANDTVSLAVLAERAHNFLLKEGVRHASDPNKNMIRAVGEGVWDFPDWLLALQRRLERCEAILNDLGGK